MTLEALRLCVVSDRARMGTDPGAAVVDLARVGLRALQWREKDLTPAQNYQWLRSIAARLDDAGLIRAEPCRGRDPEAALRLFVNDRADLALSLCLDLQLTEASMPTPAARALLHPGQLLGRSAHSLASAQAAEAGGADFVIFGPVFDTPSKRPYGPPLGLERQREVTRALSIPVLAIGGITADRVASCLEAGAFGVAVMGAVWDSADPAAAVQELLQTVGAAAGRGGPGPG